MFFDVGTSRSLPWRRRPEASRLLDELRRPDRGFRDVVIGEPQRAFWGPQYAQTFPLFVHYGVRLWVPEVGGPVDPDSEAHESADVVVRWDEQGGAEPDQGAGAVRDGGAGGDGGAVPGWEASLRLRAGRWRDPPEGREGPGGSSPPTPDPRPGGGSGGAAASSRCSPSSGWGRGRSPSGSPTRASRVRARITRSATGTERGTVGRGPGARCGKIVEAPRATSATRCGGRVHGHEVLLDPDDVGLGYYDGDVAGSMPSAVDLERAAGARGHRGSRRVPPGAGAVGARPGPDHRPATSDEAPLRRCGAGSGARRAAGRWRPTRPAGWPATGAV